MTNLKRVLTGFALVLFCVATTDSLWYCIRAGIADATTLRTRFILAQYKSEGKLPIPILWQQIQMNLQVASKLVPESSQYYEDKAYLFALRGLGFLKYEEISIINFQQAGAYYRLALIAKPMSGATWANLALANYYGGKDPAEINALFDIATSFGQHDPQTQMPLFMVGMQQWPMLSDVRKNRLRSTYANAKGRLRQELKLLAVRHAASFCIGNPSCLD